MEVDVGIKLHVVIRVLEDRNKPHGPSRALFIGDVSSFEELARLSVRYNVSRAIIDALPEQRLAFEFAKIWRRNPFRTYLAYYDRRDIGHESGRRMACTSTTSTAPRPSRRCSAASRLD